MKQALSHDKQLNLLAVKLKDKMQSKSFESVADVAPPENERDSLLREYHALGHYGEQNL
ncbi:hypothetical protein A0J61_11231, partial [Choanephora cucurbitarum]